MIMQKSMSYNLMTWIGLVGNVLALPYIAFIVSSGPPLQAANIALAISLAWPAAIVGIVASSGLLARRQWGITLSIVAISMVLTGVFPYGIVRLVREMDVISGFCLLIATLDLLALLYWCRPEHRKIRL